MSDDSDIYLEFFELWVKHEQEVVVSTISGENYRGTIKKISGMVIILNCLSISGVKMNQGEEAYIPLTKIEAIRISKKQKKGK